MEQWLTVITISVIASIINIFHVILGLAKTPVNFTYLATGHYYLDYFEYLQHIAQGKAGDWLPVSYFVTNNSLVDWRFFPYILLGKIAYIFNLSPMFIYWLSVFLLTVFILIGFYWLIKIMLNQEPFYLKIFAFIIAIVSGPFYKIIFSNGRVSLDPYDFWYGPSFFYRRFEPIPYHLLGILLLILIIIITNNLWKKFNETTNKKVLLTGLTVAVLIAVSMTFSPFALFSFIPALLIMSFIYFIKEKKLRVKIFLFNLIIFTLVIPTAILLRKSTGYGGFNFEIAWIQHVSWWFLLLSLGPMVLFFPFGLYDYFKKYNFVKYLLFIFTLISFGLFFSPIAYYLGVHNLRFFSGVSYIFYGVLTVLGIKNISILFKKYSKATVFILSAFLILYSLFLVFNKIKLKITDSDSRVPIVNISYVPNSLIAGLKTIATFQDIQNVLVAPYSNIRLLVPIFGSRRVFNLDIANQFFTGQMKEEEAKRFFKKNNIGYVVLSYLDNYDLNSLRQYHFLKLTFSNRIIKVWQLKTDYLL